MRKPTVRYFASRNAYYCQHHGKQHKLATGPDDAPSGPVYLAALDAFKQVCALGAVGAAKDRNTMRALMEVYMEHKEGKVAPATMQKHIDAFRPFLARHGSLAVCDLTHFLIYGFLAEMKKPRMGGGYLRTWGDGGALVFLRGINAVLNWATKTGLISRNPLSGIDRPAGRSRSRECVLDPVQRQQVVSAIRSPAFRRLVVALENSGARPGELVGASCSDWHDDLGAIVYYADDTRREDEFRHKSAGRKERVIVFTGATLDMVRGLVAQNKTGPIFRSKRGVRFGKSAVPTMFRKLRQRTGLAGLTAYSFRHTLATDWLTAGLDIDRLAARLGNSPATIRKHYSHLCANRGALRQCFEEFDYARSRSGGKNT